jgi:cytochrome b561
MAHLKNSINHYGLVSIFFHWLMAVLIIFMLILGLYMVSLPEVGFNTTKINYIFIHKEIGLWLLLLVIMRLIWKISNQVPQLPSHMNSLQKFAAHTTHALIYLLMLFLPITGWLMSSAGGFPVYFRGHLMPNLISYSHANFERLVLIHKWLAYFLITLLFMHITAAFLHHFYYKDTILKRMLRLRDDY